MVCAAGNEGDGNARCFEYSYPAAYVDVISVGAVDKKGVPAEFSNSNLVVDLVAPGVDILSTYPNNQFAVLSGTSMAAPHVTGSLALLKIGQRGISKGFNTRRIICSTYKIYKEFRIS